MNRIFNYILPRFATFSNDGSKQYADVKKPRSLPLEMVRTYKPCGEGFLRLLPPLGLCPELLPFASLPPQTIVSVRSVLTTASPPTKTPGDKTSFDESQTAKIIGGDSRVVTSIYNESTASSDLTDSKIPALSTSTHWATFWVMDYVTVPTTVYTTVWIEETSNDEPSNTSASGNPSAAKSEECIELDDELVSFRTLVSATTTVLLWYFLIYVRSIGVSRNRSNKVKHPRRKSSQLPPNDKQIGSNDARDIPKNTAESTVHHGNHQNDSIDSSTSDRADSGQTDIKKQTIEDVVPRAEVPKTEPSTRIGNAKKPRTDIGRSKETPLTDEKAELSKGDAARLFQRDFERGAYQLLRGDGNPSMIIAFCNSLRLQYPQAEPKPPKKLLGEVLDAFIREDLVHRPTSEFCEQFTPDALGELFVRRQYRMKDPSAFNIGYLMRDGTPHVSREFGTEFREEGDQSVYVIWMYCHGSKPTAASKWSAMIKDSNQIRKHAGRRRNAVSTSDPASTSKDHETTFRPIVSAEEKDVDATIRQSFKQRDKDVAVQAKSSDPGDRKIFSVRSKTRNNKSQVSRPEQSPGSSSRNTPEEIVTQPELPPWRVMPKLSIEELKANFFSPPNNEAALFPRQPKAQAKAETQATNNPFAAFDPPPKSTTKYASNFIPVSKRLDLMHNQGQTSQNESATTNAGNQDQKDAVIGPGPSLIEVEQKDITANEEDLEFSSSPRGQGLQDISDYISEDSDMYGPDPEDTAPRPIFEDYAGSMNDDNGIVPTESQEPSRSSDVSDANSATTVIRINDDNPAVSNESQESTASSSVERNLNTTATITSSASELGAESASTPELQPASAIPTTEPSSHLSSELALESTDGTESESAGQQHDSTVATSPPLPPASPPLVTREALAQAHRSTEIGGTTELPTSSTTTPEPEKSNLSTIIEEEEDYDDVVTEEVPESVEETMSSAAVAQTASIGDDASPKPRSESESPPASSTSSSSSSSSTSSSSFSRWSRLDSLFTGEIIYDDFMSMPETR